MGRTRLGGIAPRRRRGAAAVAAVLASLVTSVLVLAGCTAETGPRPDRPDGAALEIELTGGAGSLTPGARDELQAQVGDALTSYLVGAFLGDYPRDDFVGSLTSFTSGAAERAAGDLNFLTARRYGDADDVVAERLVARLNVFAADGEPAGASARVRFRFAVHRGEGDPRRFSVTGRLALVPEGDGWRIFGYHLSRDDSTTQEAAR